MQWRMFPVVHRGLFKTPSKDSSQTSPHDLNNKNKIKMQKFIDVGWKIHISGNFQFPKINFDQANIHT